MDTSNALVSVTVRTIDLVSRQRLIALHRFRRSGEAYNGKDVRAKLQAIGEDAGAESRTGEAGQEADRGRASGLPGEVREEGDRDASREVTDRLDTGKA